MATTYSQYYDETVHDKTKYPDKPAYFKNLEKARQVRHQNLQEKKSSETAKFLNEVGTARDMLNEPELWFDYCEKTGKKRKPGRPRLPPERLKQKPMKRSEKMQLLLEEHGVTVDEDNSIGGYDGFVFMVNGRIKFLGDADHGVEPYSMSVHTFIETYL